HDDGGVDHGADRDRDAAQGHDVGGEPLRAHGDEREQHGYRQRQDGNQSTAEVEQEEQDDEAHHDHLFGELVPQIVDGASDELRAIVGDDDVRAGRERALRLRQARFDAVDDAERVLTLAHDHDTAHHLALPVQLGNAAALLGAQMD